jgi:phytoene dehydrogenase-like protein
MPRNAFWRTDEMHDAIIIGAGHNALAAAFYLAKAGRKPLVLERRGEVGGGALTTEIHPGFQCPTLSHEVLLHDQIATDMKLKQYGVEFLTSPVRVCAPSVEGAPIVLWKDNARTWSSLKELSHKDADAYPSFRQAVDRLAGVLATTLSAPAPDINSPSAADLWSLLKTGRAFRALGRQDEFRLLRWLPMPMADLTGEWFEMDLLRAAIAGPGVSGTMLGPRSAGSSLVFFRREAHRQLAGAAAATVRGGPGALTRAMAKAARDAGAEIRTNAPVERILTRQERVVGVRSGGQELKAAAVVSSADPKTTFLELLDPLDLPPDFAGRVRNYRVSGTVAKVNLAVSSRPPFVGVSDDLMLTGRVHLGPDLDYLERAFDHAKYGEYSISPWLDVTIPSLLDSSLAPAGAHVLSVYVHYAPFGLRHGEWRASRQALLTTVLRVLEEHAPGIGSTIVASDIITPADLHTEYGLAGGHIFHGELALDQLYSMRPVLGFARYDSPIPGLFLCGGGTHPGGFLSGASGKLAARRVLQS